jgi:hypothetical protein
MEDYGDWVWDEAEYNFFMSLNDVDKLEYVFDFFNLTDEDFDQIYEFVPEVDDAEYKRVVDVTITDTHLTISCDDSELIDRTIEMLKMDGMILIPQSKMHNARVYKFIGTSQPFSVN